MSVLVRHQTVLVLGSLVESFNLKLLFQTKTVNNDLNPKWANRTKDPNRFIFDFPVHDKYNQKIKLEVFDDDDATVDDFLGDLEGHVENLVLSPTGSGQNRVGPSRIGPKPTRTKTDYPVSKMD